MNKVTFLLIILIAAAFATSVKAQEINWIDIQTAEKLSAEKPKKIIIDVYTDWCGWCKRLDATTYKDPKIVKWINDNYYAVKLDAEQKDTIVFKGYTFVNPDPTGKRSSHQFATSLLNGQMSYPTTVFLDENFALLTPLQGYIVADELMPILAYFTGDHQKTTAYEAFKKNWTEPKK